MLHPLLRHCGSTAVLACLAQCFFPNLANADPGVWRWHHEKLWNYYPTPNERDETHAQSASPLSLQYTLNYFDRNGTGRWQKDLSNVSCTLYGMEQSLRPGLKIRAVCTLNYIAQHYTSGGSGRFHVGEQPLTNPGGFRPDGTTYPMWTFETDPILTATAANNSQATAEAEFVVPRGSTPEQWYCWRIVTSIHGTAAVEVCFQWDPEGTAAVRNAQAETNLARGRPAGQSSRSQWSTATDSQGAVNGVKNGSFGFHTDLQDNPWWQVDLGASKALSEVRIFNRRECCAERARSLQVLLSDDGVSWKLVFRNDGSTFGTDGKPLSVNLRGNSARYVRLQLAERTWLHLDEVEIY